MRDMGTKNCLEKLSKWLHVVLCVAVIIYISFGAFMFTQLENYRNTSGSTTIDKTNGTGCRDDEDLSITMAVLLAFTIVTTTGYGHVVPRTASGKCFEVFYCIFGIPLTLLAVANVSRFLSVAIGEVYRKVKIRFCKPKVDKTECDETSLPLPLFACISLAYGCFGAFIVTLWGKQYTFLDGLYFSFVSLTSIGFREMLPPDKWMVVTLLYVLLGLTLSTMAVDILARYLRQLHFIGRVVKDSSKAKIWFGGKFLTVKDLIFSIGEHLKLPEETINELWVNLDNIVVQGIEDRKNGTVGKYLNAKLLQLEGEYPGSVTPDFLEACRYQIIPFMDDMSTSVVK